MPWFVNGEIVPAELVAAEAARLRPSYRRAFPDQAEDERERQLLVWARENVIEHILIRQTAEQRTSKPTPEALQAAVQRLEAERGGKELFVASVAVAGLSQKKVLIDVERHLRVEALLRSIHESLPAPTDDEIRSYYDRHREDLIVPEMVRAGHIVVHVDARRTEVEARVRIKRAEEELAGGTPFEDVVNTYSDCPDNEGDLGWFPKGEMVEEFEEVVFAMARGAVSPVIQTPFGFHIARLYDRRPAAPPPLDRAKDEIFARLRDEQRARAVEALLDSLRASAVITEQGDPA